jgi:hypothetical protein
MLGSQIPALWRRRQEDLEFKASLCYIAILCLQKKERSKKERKEGRKLQRDIILYLLE